MSSPNRSLALFHLIKGFQRRKIAYAWILLLLFISGKYIGFTHQHWDGITPSSKTFSQKDHSQKIYQKCSFCDQINHTPIDGNFEKGISLFAYSPSYPPDCTIAEKKYSLQSLSGRSPPVL